MELSAILKRLGGIVLWGAVGGVIAAVIVALISLA